MKIKKTKQRNYSWGTFVGQDFSLREATHMSTLPNKKPTTGLGTDTRKGQLDEPMSFIEVTCRIWVRGYSQRQK